MGHEVFVKAAAIGLDIVGAIDTPTRNDLTGVVWHRTPHVRSITCESKTQHLEIDIGLPRISDRTSPVRILIASS